MPGLALLAEELSSRVGFLTVLGNMERDRDTAVRIINDAVMQLNNPENVPLLTVDISDSLVNSFGGHFNSGFIPETLIIDGKGNIVERIVGGNAGEYRAALENALSDLD